MPTGRRLLLTVLLACAVLGPAVMGAGTEPVRLLRISTHLEGQSVALLLEASEPVAYAASQPDPLTILVDLRNVSVEGVANGFTASGRRPLAAVAVEKVNGIDGVPIGRVRVSLASPALPRFRSSRGTIRVEVDRSGAELTSAAASSAAPSLSPAAPSPPALPTAPAPRGAPGAAPGSAVRAPTTDAATLLEAVSTRAGPDGVVLTLRGNGQLLAGFIGAAGDWPPRLVMDFPNVSPKVAAVTEVRHEPVQRIRAVINSRSPLMTRVVVDLSRPSEYRVVPGEADQNEFTVIFPTGTTAVPAEPSVEETTSTRPGPVVRAASVVLDPIAALELDTRPVTTATPVMVGGASPASPEAPGPKVLAPAPEAPRAAVDPVSIVALPGPGSATEGPPVVSAPAASSPPPAAAAPRSPAAAVANTLPAGPAVPAAPAQSTPAVTTPSSSPAVAAAQSSPASAATVQMPTPSAPPAQTPASPAVGTAQFPAASAAAAQMPAPPAQMPAPPAQMPAPPAQMPALPPPSGQTPAPAPAPQTPTGADQQYTGHPVTLDFQNADLRAVLRAFAEISGLNLVIDPAVQGTVDVQLRDVPWDQALDIILRANKLGYSLDGTIVRVAPLEVLRLEQEERKKLADAQALVGELQILTRTLSYARATALAQLVTRTALSPRGTVQVDDRTNTLIITDLQGPLDAALKLITTLDRPEPQVEIEARVVQTNRDFLREIGVQLGVTGRVAPELGNTTNLVFPNRGGVTGRLGNQGGPGAGDPRAGDFEATGSAVNLPAANATSAIGLALGAVNGAFNLDVALSALERTGRGRILSTPRVSTQNNVEAEITQGVQIPIQTVANNTVTVAFRDAALTLRVTPQITSANTVIMRIVLENSSPDFSRQVNGIPPIDTQRANTQVQVNDGATTVIGGIFLSREQSVNDRTPFLHRIPLLGWLFKRDSVTEENRELLIFITPRITRE